MEILDCSKEFSVPQSNVAKHSILFPKNIFCVISGSTGSGKTNLLVHLLKKEKILNYSDVFVYCSKLYQPAYEHLKIYYEKLEKLIQNKTNK
jgi:ABC-type lipoprotein export system ATPase subunit